MTNGDLLSRLTTNLGCSSVPTKKAKSGGNPAVTVASRGTINRAIVLDEYLIYYYANYSRNYKKIKSTFLKREYQTKSREIENKKRFIKCNP